MEARVSDEDDDLTWEQRVYFAGQALRNEELMAQIAPHLEATAAYARMIDAHGLATAALLLKESLLVYCTEMGKFADSLTKPD